MGAGDGDHIRGLGLGLGQRFDIYGIELELEQGLVLRSWRTGRDAVRRRYRYAAR